MPSVGRCFRGDSTPCGETVKIAGQSQGAPNMNLKDEDIAAELLAQKAAIIVLLQAVQLLSEDPPGAREALRFRIRETILSGSLAAEGVAPTSAVQTRALRIAELLFHTSDTGPPSG